MEELIVSWLSNFNCDYLKITNNESIQKIYNLLSNNIIFDPQDNLEMLYLAIYYRVNENYDLAEKFYIKSADSGNTIAMNNFAILCEKYKKNYNLAEKYYLMAIKKGCIESMNNLAMFYDNIKNRCELAEKYYLMAIYSGCVNATNNLAMMYYKNKKYELAEKYLLIAVERGHVESMYNLSVFHQNITKNNLLVEKYYLMAIDNDDLESLKNLSYFYKSFGPSYKNKLLDLYYKYVSLDDTFRDKLNSELLDNNNFIELLKYKDCLNKNNRKRFNKMLILFEKQKHIILEEVVEFECINCNSYQKCVSYTCGHFYCVKCFNNNIDCRLCCSG